MRTTPTEAAGLLRVLLAALVSVGLLLPAVDHHLVERMPWHHHLSPVGGVAQAAHRHAYEHEHHHVTRGPLVLVADAIEPGAVSATGMAPATSGEALNGPGHMPLLLALADAIPLAVGPARLLPAGHGLPPAAQAAAPDPPPPVFFS